MNKKIFITVLAGLLWFHVGWSKVTVDTLHLRPLAVGDEVPDIVFKDKHTFPEGVASISDLKGKLVLLDFWGIGCISCMQAFPKMAELQKEFEGRLQIVLLNAFSADSVSLAAIHKLKNETIKTAFFSLPSSSGDKRWMEVFPHRGVPHHVWISPSGKVIAITGDQNATSENIQRLLQGENVHFAAKSDLVGYDIRENGFMNKGHVELPDPKFYSAFLPNHFGIGGGTYIVEDTVKGVLRCTQRNLTIPTLYKLAARKERVLVETNRIPDIGEYINADEWQKNNLYSYELLLPLNEKVNYRNYMWEDLNRYFGMTEKIEGVIQRRSCSAYLLISGETTSDHSTELTMLSRHSPDSIKSQTIPKVSLLYAFIKNRFEDVKNHTIVLDETGLDPNDKIDLVIPTNITSIEALREYIQPYGFDIRIENRYTDILVIRDKVDSTSLD